MICLSTLHAILLLCFIVGSTTWYNYIFNHKDLIYNEPAVYFKEKNSDYFIEKQKVFSDNEPNNKQIILVDSGSQNSINNPLRLTDNNINLIHKRDHDVLYNNFKPPERRVPEYQYPTDYISTQINFPSRGYPEEYQLLGIASRENTETVYNLYGRQKYPGSSQYEYYVMGSDNKNFNVKIPIHVKGDKEIYNNDTVHIHGTDPSKGHFKVNLYNLNAPRYIPNI